MKKNKFFILMFTLILIASTIGCTSNKFRQPIGTETKIGDNITKKGVKRDNVNTKGIVKKDINKDVRQNQVLPGPNTATDITKRNNLSTPDDMAKKAANIAEKITNLKEINSASVLISGNSCIVGVDIKNNIEGKMTTDLKQKIERIVRNTDNSIKYVSITADPDLYTRIRNMAADIANGRPISGFANEFEEILRRITPVK
ncbi:YhcN/YlaJ family sporulation lipoprotein [Keratinibaculum paraultunense]|uniref:YhcN/YlaJ family sporulation lipoprotein n=1 Tax=Keratinibaculum paraultunense TaxID=1278232 RepID=A0A4R3L3X0_9FIRM|nr:YhcN/YlaJ family sporulation lipoprotein [Keratinibaculum paraultunense]QQY80583.1 YhcN/YlaJ family sporulation lipoprotein [Keratinibaculum paraultunense]TCS91313.1 YhcN/YlaJ family sporulation lipoprotein [Keratinibaculum paraultunense]